MYQDYVLVLKRVTRNAPLQFFGQPTVKNNHSQFLKFFLPLLSSTEKGINLLIHSVHLLILLHRNRPARHRVLIGRLLRNESLKDMAFPHPKSRQGELQEWRYTEQRGR